MSKHNQTGLNGEKIGVNYLRDNHYEILETNWRYERKEIDCIARKDGEYIFVEIKTRTGLGFGFPEEAVDPRKKKLLMKAAEAYMNTIPGDHTIRFDIMSILLRRDQEPEIFHIIDAFY